MTTLNPFPLFLFQLKLISSVSVDRDVPQLDRNTTTFVAFSLISSRDNVVNHLLVPSITQCHSDITIMKVDDNKWATPSDLQECFLSGNFFLHDSIV